MNRNIFFLTLVGLLCVGLVSGGYVWAKLLSEQPTVTLLYPKELSDCMLWPTNRSWIWSVNRLDSPARGNALSLVARVVHQHLQKGESPTVGSRLISKPESEAELRLGKLLGIESAGSTLVCVQLMDLGEASIPVRSDKRRLRLLLHLQVGSSMTSRLGEESGITGDSYVGQVPHAEPKWRDGELHLQNLFVREGDRVAIYDILVLQSK